jgi:hypothetical protein
MNFNVKLIPQTAIKILLSNLLRCAVYFFILSGIVLLLYHDTPAEILPHIFSGGMPDTYITVFFSSIIFTLFVMGCGALAASKEQSHFQTGLIIRIFLFVMNVMPIALFQHLLIPMFGFRIIFFFLFYFLLQILFDSCLKHLLLKIMADKNILMGKIAQEMMLVVLSICAASAITPSEYHTFNMRNMEFTDAIQLVVYGIYIIFFNAVTFFMVENCINIFRQEYNKNYTRFYFMYNYSAFARIIQILRNSLPEMLQKFRKNLTWLVMFIIAVDSIFENINSIGFSLLDGYNYDSAIIIKNIFCVLAIMLIINTALDFLQHYLHSRNHAGRHDQTDVPLIQIKDNFIFANKRRRIIFTVSAVIYLGLFSVCLVLYPFAGYYDFGANQSKTVRDFLRYNNIPDENCLFPLMQYYDAPLCDAGENSFSLIRLKVYRNNKVFTITPFYDKADRTFYFIKGFTNRQKTESLYPSDSILSVLKMKLPRFTGLTAFRLPADTSGGIYIQKPVWMTALFCLFYMATLLAIIFMLTYFFYSIEKIPKLLTELVAFLNTSTLILVFLLLNLFIRNIDIRWENNSFALNAAAYIIAQVMIILMFSDNYSSEIKLFKNRTLSSSEFKYYSLIGMSKDEITKIFHKKYGVNLFIGICLQNILFVFNLNWFIIYAFNVWKNFNDSTGLTYAISFENIFTKMVHDLGGQIGFTSVLLLAAINIALFILYYKSQNRIYKGVVL